MEAKKKILIAVIAAAVVIVAVLAVFIANMGKALDSENAEAVAVNIVSGSTTEQIGEALVNGGVIDSASRFKLWSKIKGYDSEYKAGVYSLSPSMDYSTIADILVGGKVAMTAFTVPEGLTVEQTVEKLVEQGMGEKEVFENEVKDKKWFDKYEFLSYGSNAEQMKENLADNYLEGYLMPNTYYVATGASEEEIIDVMLRQFDRDVYQGIFKEFQSDVSSLIKTKYDAYFTSENGFQLRDVIKYASIIERETMLDEERPLVASVICNRLQKGMNFQMCSTVQYILGYQKDNLTYDDIAIDSPYNSYIHENIPGPICSPGTASIKAAFYPADTDYLYFVVSDKLDGSMNFSADYGKFDKDKAAYDKAYDAAH